MNVYFVPEASEESILSMKSDIEGLPEVASVTYVSREQALEDLVERRRDDRTSFY